MLNYFILILGIIYLILGFISSIGYYYISAICIIIIYISDYFINRQDNNIKRIITILLFIFNITNPTSGYIGLYIIGVFCFMLVLINIITSYVHRSTTND